MVGGAKTEARERPGPPAACEIFYKAVNEDYGEDLASKENISGAAWPNPEYPVARSWVRNRPRMMSLYRK